MKPVFLPLYLCFFSAFSQGNFLTSSKPNFIELGTGVTQFGFAKEQLKDYDVQPSANLKMIFGGRIGKKPYSWFEISYNFNGAFITEDSETTNNGQTDVTETDQDKFTSQSIALGLRFTTNPYRALAGYIRLGGGDIYTHIRTTEKEEFADGSPTLINNNFEEFKDTFYYGAGGLSFQFNRYNRISIEAQQNSYSINTMNFDDQLLTINWSRFL